MFKRIDHIEIIPVDFDRAMDFYTNVLGFKVKERKRIDRPPLMEIAYIALGDSVIEMMSVSEKSPASGQEWQVGYKRIALEVENMDRAIEYLKSRGVRISREPVNLGASRRAEIEDPDGLSIELRQW
ncbi:MAG: VOC family protein [Chloroflexi bacterium]|nr:VOC family protein [Chloroflexota bacterium]